MTDAADTDRPVPAPGAGAQATSEAAEREGICVGWVAGRETLRQFGSILKPMAIGLLDDLVELVAFCPAGVDPAPLPSPPIRLVRYGRLRPRALFGADADAVVREIHSRRIKVLHALDASAAPVAAQMAALAEVYYMVTSWSLADAAGLGVLKERALGILPASEPIHRHLLERHVAPVEKTHLLRPGVWADRRATCFSRLDRSVAIVVGGALDDAGPFHGALRVFAALAAEQRDCAYFVLGSGKAERPLRAAARRLGLTDRLTFADPPSVSELRSVFVDADVYVAPAVGEAVDLRLLLAMASGVPVVAAAGGACDFLADGRTALRFAPDDTDALLERLIGLLDDHAAARALAERALEHMRSHHSPAGAVAELARLYRHGAAGRAVGAGPAM